MQFSGVEAYDFLPRNYSPQGPQLSSWIGNALAAVKSASLPTVPVYEREFPDSILPAVTCHLEAGAPSTVIWQSRAAADPATE